MLLVEVKEKIVKVTMAASERTSGSWARGLEYKCEMRYNAEGSPPSHPFPPMGRGMMGGGEGVAVLYICVLPSSTQGQEISLPRECMHMALFTEIKFWLNVGDPATFPRLLDTLKEGNKIHTALPAIYTSVLTPIMSLNSR